MSLDSAIALQGDRARLHLKKKKKKFIHVFSWLDSLFFLSLITIPLYGCSTVCFFIHEDEGTSWLLPIFDNKAAVHIQSITLSPRLERSVAQFTATSISCFQAILMPKLPE